MAAKLSSSNASASGASKRRPPASSCEYPRCASTLGAAVVAYGRVVLPVVMEAVCSSTSGLPTFTRRSYRSSLAVAGNASRATTDASSPARACSHSESAATRPSCNEQMRSSFTSSVVSSVATFVIQMSAATVPVRPIASA